MNAMSPESGVGEFNPAPYRPDTHLADAINDAICNSEIHGGVELSELAPGAVVEVTTRHHTYTLENRGDGDVLICGHPMYCPEPVLVRFHGSTWGTPLIRRRFFGVFLRWLVHPRAPIEPNAIANPATHHLGKRRLANLRVDIPQRHLDRAIRLQQFPVPRRRFIGREMRMEFRHPVFGVLLTSHVSEIRELPPSGLA